MSFITKYGSYLTLGTSVAFQIAGNHYDSNATPASTALGLCAAPLIFGAYKAAEIFIQNPIENSLNVSKATIDTTQHKNLIKNGLLTLFCSGTAIMYFSKIIDGISTVYTSTSSESCYYGVAQTLSNIAICCLAANMVYKGMNIAAPPTRTLKSLHQQ